MTHVGVFWGSQGYFLGTKAISPVINCWSVFRHIFAVRLGRPVWFDLGVIRGVSSLSWGRDPNGVGNSNRITRSPLSDRYTKTKSKQPSWRKKRKLAPWRRRGAEFPPTHPSLSLSLSLSFSLPLFLFPFLKLGGSHVFLCTSPLFFLPFRIDAAEKAKNLSRATEKKEEDNIGGNPRCSIANLSRLPKRPTDRTPPHRPEHADTTPTGAKHTQTLCLYSNETAHRRLPSRFL